MFAVCVTETVPEAGVPLVVCPCAVLVCPVAVPEGPAVEALPDPDPLAGPVWVVVIVGPADVVDEVDVVDGD